MPTTSDAEHLAADVGDSTPVRVGVRIGYAVNALLHLLLGWIALQVAFGHAPKNADQSGALQILAGQSLGRITLWIGVVGFALLAVWQLAQAIAPSPGASEAGDRIKAVAKAVVYLALAASAWSFVQGNGTSSKSQTKEFTATLMGLPAGRWLVALVGLGIVAVGGYHIYKGWTKKFLQDLVEHPGQWAVSAGRIGYVAKGLALGIVGVLFVLAAWRAKPSEAGGLDTALRTLRGQPFGTGLLVVIGVGLALFGIYTFARARYTKV